MTFRSICVATGFVALVAGCPSANAQAVTCPDGGRAYFGVCPDGNKRPTARPRRASTRVQPASPQSTSTTSPQPSPPATPPRLEPYSLAPSLEVAASGSANMRLLVRMGNCTQARQVAGTIGDMETFYGMPSVCNDGASRLAVLTDITPKIQRHIVNVFSKSQNISSYKSDTDFEILQYTNLRTLFDNGYCANARNIARQTSIPGMPDLIYALCP